QPEPAAQTAAQRPATCYRQHGKCQSRCKQCRKSCGNPPAKGGDPVAAHKAPSPTDRDTCEQEGPEPEALEQQICCIGARPAEGIGNLPIRRMIEGGIAGIEPKTSGRKQQAEKQQEEAGGLDQALAQKFPAPLR